MAGGGNSRLYEHSPRSGGSRDGIQRSHQGHARGIRTGRKKHVKLVTMRAESLANHGGRLLSNTAGAPGRRRSGISMNSLPNCARPAPHSKKRTAQEKTSTCTRLSAHEVRHGAFVICSSHIRQGGHQNASPLISRLFVRIVVDGAELLLLSIPVLDSTIFSVSNNNVDALEHFLWELVVLVRRIISPFGDVFSDKLSVLWEL